MLTGETRKFIREPTLYNHYAIDFFNATEKEMLTAGVYNSPEAEAELPAVPVKSGEQIQKNAKTKQSSRVMFYKVIRLLFLFCYYFLKIILLNKKNLSMFFLHI